MENFIDGNEVYQRLKPQCKCWHPQHCGHSCIESDCDCNECQCPDCLSEAEK
jgi:hypothetical protein